MHSILENATVPIDFILHKQLLGSKLEIREFLHDHDDEMKEAGESPTGTGTQFKLITTVACKSFYLFGILCVAN